VLVNGGASKGKFLLIWREEKRREENSDEL